MSLASINGMSLRTSKTSGQASASKEQSSGSSKSQSDTTASNLTLDSEIDSDVTSLRQRIKELEEKEKLLERNVRQRQAECDEQKSALRTIQDEFMVSFLDAIEYIRLLGERSGKELILYFGT